MEKKEFETIGLLMDAMNQGIVFVNTERKIEICNRKAKEFTGIVFNPHACHDAGSLKEGDIVILADNKLGVDDGNMTAEELELLNIRDKDIRKGDTLVAVGVFKNKKIEPEYKYLRGDALSLDLKLDVNYLGFHIEAMVNAEKKETLIVVDGTPYKLDYFNAIGNMVIIDRTSGMVKFFQARGYTTRGEDAGNILRGRSYYGKSTEDTDIDVTGRGFLDFFEESALTDKLFTILDKNAEPVKNHLYQINKRPFVCTIIPWSGTESDSSKGVFLMIRNAENIEKLLYDRNEIIRQLENEISEESSDGADFAGGEIDRFIGKSNAAKDVKYMAYKASKNKVNVIITGESGTGKSMLAREIHRMGNPDAPFVEVNCNAIAPTLFESELFGYVGGAFTGAKSEGKIGFFESADKGTIFLDEIGEIPPEIQVKLLHALQNKIIYRVGSSKPIKVDVRVIAATNKNLEEEVTMGRFRQDLFYRINVFPIDIPPIRERKTDLYLLINRILKNPAKHTIWR